jgi:hypothetical protein
MRGSLSRYVIVAAAGLGALCFLPWCAAQDAAPAAKVAAAKASAPTPATTKSASAARTPAASESTPVVQASAASKSTQAAKQTPAAKPTPRAADGHPDLSGFYNLGDVYAGDPVEEKPGQHVVVRSADGSVFFDYGGANAAGSEQVGTKVPQTQNGKKTLLDRTCVSCAEPPYKPEYIAKAKAIGDAMHGDASPADPQYDCIPYGVPRGSLRGGGGYAMQIVQNRDVVAFLYEDRPGPYFRIVYLNGEHPKDLDPSYYGHSIGHWEGDTLVVDVVGLNDETWLGSGTVGPKLAMMHSDQLHVVERWTRAGDVLTYEATVEDPVMFTKPWVMTPRQTQIAAPGDYIRPTMCLPLDKSHLVKEDETPYVTSKDAVDPAVAAAAAAKAAPNIAGSWNVQIYSTIEGMMNQQWVMKQEGSKVTGTVTSKSGEMPLEGTLHGAYLEATVTDGQKRYDVRATVVAKDIDGSIKINRNEFRLAGKQAK